MAFSRLPSIDADIVWAVLLRGGDLPGADGRRGAAVAVGRQGMVKAMPDDRTFGGS